MVTAMAAPAVSQSLLLPNRLPVSSIPPYSSSRSRHFQSFSSILHFKNHDCNDSSSSLFRAVVARLCFISVCGSSQLLPLVLSCLILFNREKKQLKLIEIMKYLSNGMDGQQVCCSCQYPISPPSAANIPFLLLQLPQIWLNACNLMSGNYSALLAVNWLGSLTGLLGNLSLLSYFAKKRETEAMIVQCLGVLTTYAMISQLAMAGAMPSLYFFLTSTLVGVGVISNFLNYSGMLPSIIWGIWEDFITVGGLSVLPQVMWPTFVPYIPNSMLPGAISFVLAMIAAVVARTGKLSAQGVKFYGAIAGWTATLLFMWMPVPQLWTNLLNPENIRGLSSLTMLLAMAGNGLMIPRALFIRDFMWFLGSSWASFLYGWGNLLCMYMFNSISREYFFAITAGLFIWIGLTFRKDSEAYGHSSPLRSFKELLFGS